jgi:hypothetical protein
MNREFSPQECWTKGNQRVIADQEGGARSVIAVCAVAAIRGEQ